MYVTQVLRSSFETNRVKVANTEGSPCLDHSSGSPVINKGNPSSDGLPGRDQRGLNFYRIRGGRVDIGAVEVQEGSFPGGMSAPPISGDDRRYH